MRLYTVVPVTIAVLITCCEVFATTKEFSQIKEDFVRASLASLRGNAKEGRLLRIASDLLDTENRGITSGLTDMLQMRRWVNTDEADDIVMKELDLTGRIGKDLTRHPNYKRLQEFLSKREDKRMEVKMERMIDDGVSTDFIWRKYHLWTLPEAERKNSKEFQYYLRYATMYDHKIFWSENLYTRPVVYYHGTKEELLVKTGIWAAADRPNDYVKAMLLLDDASETKLLANPYYKEFLKLQAAKKLDRVTSA